MNLSGKKVIVVGTGISGIGAVAFMRGRCAGGSL